MLHSPMQFCTLLRLFGWEGSRHNASPGSCESDYSISARKGVVFCEVIAHFTKRIAPLFHTAPFSASARSNDTRWCASVRLFCQGKRVKIALANRLHSPPKLCVSASFRPLVQRLYNIRYNLRYV